MAISKTIKTFLCSALLLICFLFYRPIVQAVLGAVVKGILLTQCDCRLAYRSLSCSLSEIVFSDLVLFDLSGERSAFHVHALKAVFHFDWSEFPKKLKGSLEIDRPQVTLSELRNWEGGGGWFEFAVAARDGMLEIPGIEPAHFSYVRTSPQQMGRLDLNWRDSGISLEGVNEGSETKVDADFRQFKAPLLVPLVDFFKFSLFEQVKVKEGSLNGWIHFVSEGKQAKRASSHLEMESISIEMPKWKCQKIDGVIDWEGPLGLSKRDGLLGDFYPFHLDGRLRTSLTQGAILAPGGAIEEMKGNLSYNPGLGAKWEMKGIGKAKGEVFELLWEGRGYFHSQRANWIEADLYCGKKEGSIPTCFMKGIEEGAARIWSGSVHGLRSEHAVLFQSLVQSLALPLLSERVQESLESWNLKNGILSGEANLSISDKGIGSWQLSQIHAEEIEAQNGDFQIYCKKGEGRLSEKGGDFLLKGGQFLFLLPERAIEGTGWDGEWKWEKGVLAPSLFSGWIGEGERKDGGIPKKLNTALTLSGTWKEWKAIADLAGFAAGRIFLQGEWEGKKLDIRVEKGAIEGLHFSGSGWIDEQLAFSLNLNQFEGDLDWLGKVWKGYTFKGRISSQENGFLAVGDPEKWEWNLVAQLEKVCASSLSFPHWRVENGKMEISASTGEWSFYSIDGEWITPQGKIHFISPFFKKRSDDWAFDLRLDNKTWDLLRLTGTSDGKKVYFDEKRSHLLGNKVHFVDCDLELQGKIDVQFKLPWEAVLAAQPLFPQWIDPSWISAPLAGTSDIHFHYCGAGGSEVSIRGLDLEWKQTPLTIDLHAIEQSGGRWCVDRFELGDLSLNCLIVKEEEIFQIGEGKGKWKNGVEARFEGKGTPDLKFDLVLPQLKIDLSQIAPLASLWGLPLQKLEGILEGGGHLRYQEELESDLDLTPLSLKAGPLVLENNGTVHLYYSSKKGVLFQGLDLHVLKPDLDSPWIDCKIDLVQYDAIRSHWVLNHSHVHLPADLFTTLQKGPPFLRFFDKGQDLDFTADLDCSADFSKIACAMKEGFIPFSGAVRHVQKLRFNWNKEECQASFYYFHQGRLVKVGMDVELEPKIGGRLTLEEEESPLCEGERPLTLDWDYEEDRGIAIHAIDGSFGGIDASFHAEGSADSNTLIGSARINFASLCPFIPPETAHTFQELKMGKGYELKGRLQIGKGTSSFRGILCGKQLELFGFQFRTLLAQVDFQPSCIRIYDLKISDTAGMMKIDEIRLEGKENQPMTIAIPHLSILELRPSLLQKVGEEPGPISPLVVREFKISDFKGILEDGKTYTGKGQLHFINSYRREHTVFDLPADVLSRIVGIDLELLIPACGTLSYELKDGLFLLTELKGAFSAGKRSEFFLEKGEQEPFPFMDLDGNLKILVKMKQFVLFKITEAFLISIDGTLSDPKFHLQKKKRFFGI